MRVEAEHKERMRRIERRAEDGIFKTARLVIRRYEGIHLTLGILGNTCFFVGSILFLFPPWKDPGVWLFIFGSAGMLIGSLGRAIVRYEERRQERRLRAGEHLREPAGWG